MSWSNAVGFLTLEPTRSERKTARIISPLKSTPTVQLNQWLAWLLFLQHGPSIQPNTLCRHFRPREETPKQSQTARFSIFEGTEEDGRSMPGINAYIISHFFLPCIRANNFFSEALSPILLSFFCSSRSWQLSRVLDS